MSATISWDDVEVGAALPEKSFPITRLNLVMYAGASGDFNPIHWDERFAKQVGLPDTIAHGMLTMAKASQVVTSWVGDPGSVVEYGVRMTRPIVVPPGWDGAQLVVTGKVAEKLDQRRVAVDLDARVGGETVLAKARAVVQLA